MDTPTITEYRKRVVATARLVSLLRGFPGRASALTYGQRLDRATAIREMQSRMRRKHKSTDAKEFAGDVDCEVLELESAELMA